jgi:hypothetical protein
VGIGHDGDVFMDKGQVSQIPSLFQGPGVNVIKPEFNRLFFSGDYFLQMIHPEKKIF